MHSLSSPFSFLENVPAGIVGTALANERAEIAAITLSQMRADRVPGAFSQFGPALKREVVCALQNLQPICESVLRQVAAGVFIRVQAVRKQGGLMTVLEILSECDREVENLALSRLQSVDPSAVKRIESCLLQFNDLAVVNDRVLRTLLRNIDLRTWATALKRSSESLKQRVGRQLTSQAVRILSDEIDYLGTVVTSEVDAAQQNIVDVARLVSRRVLSHSCKS